MDGVVTEQALPEPPTPSPAASGHMRLEDVSGLFMWVSAQIAGTEGRITASIERHMQEERERWTSIEETLRHLDHRVEVLEERNALDQATYNARVKPVRTIAGWVGAHYRDIAFLAIAILTALGIINGAAT
jgi:hypothetical protein